MSRLGGLGAALSIASGFVAATASAQPTAAVYFYAEDAASAPVAAQLSDAMVRRANGTNKWRASVEKSVGELIDRSPDDLVRAAEALAAARAAYAEGLEHNTRLRLELAQDTLQRARANYMEAAVGSAYQELRDVHLYLGVILFNQGHPDIASQHFRQAAFLSPQLQLNRDVFSPSVVAAFELAKRGVSVGPKGSLRIECDVPSARVLLDGVDKGPAANKLLAELPEGEHYIEVRAPGGIPQLQAIPVAANSETPVVFSLRRAGGTMKQTWGSPKGETGGAAIARILKVERLVLGSVRSSVAGMLPYTARAAAFDAASGRRFTQTESGLTNANDASRVTRLTDTLFGKQQVAVAGRAGVVAARTRFLERDSASVTLETGVAFQNRVYDEKGRYVASDSWGEFEQESPDQDFDRYSETRTTFHLRYGLREKATVFAAVPFYTKELHYEYDRNENGTIEGGEDDVKRDDSGVGDVVLGADVRVPRLEVGPLSLMYVQGRVELPTGSSAEACGFIRRYCSLVMGSGQWDVYLGLGGMIARDNFRFGFQAGYNARLPDRVWYYSAEYDAPNDDWNFQPQRHLDPGDEQKLRLDGAYHIGTWLAPEAYLDFTRRNETRKFVDPVTHRPGTAPEMMLLDLGVGIRAEFTEKTRAGVMFQHPVFGKATMTFFPLDVTGPRAYAYVGYRF